jgi:hypothetical protein
MERSPDLAKPLYRARNKGLVAIPLGIVAGYVLGIPTSFYGSRHSLPWEPFDIVIVGTIWAFVFCIFTILIAVILQRYVSLYRNGVAVASLVVSEQNRAGQRGVVLQFSDRESRTRYSWVFPSSLPVGEESQTILATGTSKLVLNRNGDVGYVRGSSLDETQIASFTT